MTARPQLRNRFGHPLARRVFPPKTSLSVERLEARELLAAAVTLDLQPPAGAAVVSVPLASYQLGFQNSATPTTAGQTSFDELQAAVPLVSNTPALLQALTQGRTYDRAVLTQRDEAGNPVVIWSLGTVLVTSSNPAGGVSGLPVDNLRFAFGSVRELTSTGTASWNRLTNSTSGLPASPPAPTTPLPVADAFITLDIPSTPAGPAFSVPLTSYQFGFRTTTTGRAAFDKLQLATSLGRNSPRLLQFLANGTAVNNVVLTQRDGDGNRIAAWSLGGVLVSDHDVQGNAGGLPVESFQLTFGSVTEATSARTVSWNQATNSTSGVPAPPAAIVTALEVPTEPEATLQFLAPSAGLPALTIPLSSYQFGTRNTGTALAFSHLQVTTEYAGSSPAFLQALTTGGRYNSAVLAQRNEAGQVVISWTLGNVSVASDVIRGDPGGPPIETLQLQFFTLAEANTLASASAGVAAASVPVVAPPAPAPSPASLQFTTVTGATASVPLTSYQFGYRNPTTVGTTTTLGRTAFDELVVEMPYTGNSIRLFQSFVNGRAIAPAVLTQTNAAGQPFATWALGSTFVVSDDLRGSVLGLPTRVVRLSFGSVRETVAAATGTTSGTWNVILNSTTNTPAAPPTALTPLPAPAATAVTLQLTPTSGPPVTLQLDSFQLGYQNPVTVGSASTGRTTFDALEVTLPYGGNSPLLFQALALGRSYSTAVLTQSSAAGGIPLAAWSLGTVFVTEDAIRGTTEGLPRETIKFVFGAITERTGTQNTSWSVITNSPSGAPAAPPGTLGALPTPPAAAAFLQLQGSSIGLPELTIPLTSFRFDFQNSTVLGSLTAGRTTFGELVVQTPYGVNSPSLLASLTRGGSYSNAVLTQRDAAGLVVATFALGRAFVSDDVIQGGGLAGVPLETIRVAFSSITERTRTLVTSWDQVVNRVAGPAGVPVDFDLPDGLAPTVTTLIPSALSSVTGEPVTFTATVRALAATVPVGNVTFYDGAVPLATVPLEADGTATYTTTFMPGFHSITAFWDRVTPEEPFRSSVSDPPFPWPAFAAPTSLTLTPGAGLPFRPEVLTAAVRVVAPGTGTATGTVRFFDGDLDLGTATLVDGVARLTIPSLLPGRHDFRAVYEETADYLGSAGAAPVVSLGGEGERFVAQLYQDLLRRAADAAGLADWANRLGRGTSRAEVVQGFLDSTEYRSNQIRDLYLTLLDREADAAGLAGFLGQLASGSSLTQVEARLLGSLEYAAKNGSNTEGFLNALYDDVLFRGADEDGRAAFAAALAAGRSAEEVARAVLTSQEARERRVQTYYDRFLDREADAPGLEGWATTLATGGIDQVLAGFVLGEEYRGRL